MNERIRKLAVEAGFGIDEIGDANKKDKIEKLIKLVAKGCVGQIEEVSLIKGGNSTVDYNCGFSDGMLVAIRTIEEDFDIE